MDTYIQDWDCWDCSLSLYLALVDNAIQLTKVVVLVYSLTIMRVLVASHPCQCLVLCLLNVSHSGECVIVYRCGFDLHFPKNMMLCIISVLIIHLNISLVQYLFKSFALFLLFLFCFAFVSFYYWVVRFISNASPLWDRYVFYRYFPLLCDLFWHSNFMYVRPFSIVPLLLDSLFSRFFSPLCFNLDNFCSLVFKFTNSPLSCVLIAE